MKSNIEISQEAKVLPIDQIAAQLGIAEEELIPFGRHMAKVPLSVLRRYEDRPNGKLILSRPSPPLRPERERRSPPSAWSRP